MKKILIVLSIFIANSNYIFGQVQGGPPPAAAEADKENEILIDELIAVCNYRLLFNQLKDSIINDFSKKNFWSESKIEEVRSMTKYEDFSSDMYYNEFSSETKEELLQLLSYYKTIPKNELKKEFKNYNSMIIHNYTNSIVRSCRKE